MNHKHSPALLAKTLDWEDLRFFATLARHGTLTGAARALRTSAETVERRLVNLETTLGHPLFSREGSGFSLNAAGAEVFSEAAQMEMAACSLAHRVATRS
jgi:DNA-binding transcriptional LysR family regulator